MNAADEAAVEAFLSGGLSFGAIPGVIEETLAHFAGAPALDTAQLIELGRQAGHTRATSHGGAAADARQLTSED